MKWQGRQRSRNIDDRRGQSSSSGRGGGGMNPMMLAALGRILFSKTGVILVALFLLLTWLTGTNPLSLISQFTGSGSSSSSLVDYQPSAEEQELAEMTSVVLRETEIVWGQLIEDYRQPGLVLFSEQVSSACGFASAASGPFYCPGDEKVYIDLNFFQEMGQKLGASGDFAQAYVIAHEVGHHVQLLDGTLQKVQSMRNKLPQPEFNRLMVRLELQADFYAGVWAHYVSRYDDFLEVRDLEEALNAASAVGDDRLQKQATGMVVPDSFTHGTSEQRMRWFRKGFETGDPSQGDTFNATRL